MNLYGFAGGDPVNFSDPMGLCPQTGSLLAIFTCNAIEATTTFVGSVAGGTLGAGGGLGASLATGDLDPVMVGGGALAGAAAGAVAGKLAGEFITDRLFSRDDRSKGKEGGQQFDEISKRQQQLRKQGQGDKINSIEKSRQRDQRELREEAERALEELRKRKP